MKFVICSDLHLGNTTETESTLRPQMPFDKAEHERFAAEMHAHKPDALVVLGDCAETCLWDDFLAIFFDLYRNPHGASIAIPGNHDLWLGRPLRTTYEEAFANFFSVAADKKWVGIKDEPWVKDGIWIAGGMGWYDFSTRDPEYANIDPIEFDEKVCRAGGWADYPRMNMRSALAVNKVRMAEFKACLAKAPPPDQRKGLVVISHFPGFERLLSDDFGRPDWGRAFMGNNEIGKLVAKSDAQYYFCGHSHRRREFQLGDTKCINNGSGYGAGSKRYDIVEF